MKIYPKNTFDLDAVFENYQVSKATKKATQNIGIISAVDIMETAHDLVDTVPKYNITLTIVMEQGDQLVKRYKEFRDILLSGRNAFQRFAVQFDLIKTNKNGVTVFHPELLPGKLCNVRLANLPRFINRIEAPIIQGQEEETYYQALYKDVTITAYDKRSLTEPLRFFRPIPSIAPENDFTPYPTYHGCIAGLQMKQDLSDPDDAMLIVNVLAFNGGTSKMFQKYFNNCMTTGREKMDRFFHEFGVVQKDMRIDLNRLADRICAVTLHETRNHKLYIDTLTPLTVKGKNARKQYLAMKEYHMSSNS